MNNISHKAGLANAFNYAVDASTETRATSLQVLAKPSTSVLTMNLSQIRSVALAWASHENWNIRTGDLTALYNQDPSAFSLLSINQQPVATILNLKHCADSAFIGLYITNPHYRNRGYGKYLWDYTQSRTDSRIIGLHAVEDQISNYAKEGFKLHPLLTTRISLDKAKLSDSSLPTQHNLSSVIIKPLSLSDFNILFEYDFQISLTNKAIFLKTLLSIKNTIALGAWSNNQLVGYGFMRKCTQQGLRVAPLYADNDSICWKLLISLSKYAQRDEPIYIDAPQSKHFLLPALEKLFTVNLMYKGDYKIRNKAAQSVYGISSMEGFPV